jgi:hypothetical protein
MSRTARWALNAVDYEPSRSSGSGKLLGEFAGISEDELAAI